MLLGAATLALVVLITTAITRRRPGASASAIPPDPEGNLAGARTNTLPAPAPVLAGAPRTAAPLLTGGLICGLILFMGSNLQQTGMVFTTASKAGFITTLYIVLVPILGIALKHKTHWNTWASVAIALAGLYFLCLTEGLALQTGDLYLLVCALFWAGHILAVDHFINGLTQREVMKLCVIQFATCGVLSLAAAPFLDGFFMRVPLSLEGVSFALPEIAYAGILSTGVAFTLQAVGQRYANPSAAAVIMSLEAAFGLLGGVVLLHEALSGREVVGCVLMFVAVILAQLTLTQGRLEQKGNTHSP
jgi:drug/metabolite transporter (DMT)-like permease